MGFWIHLLNRRSRLPRRCALLLQFWEDRSCCQGPATGEKHALTKSAGDRARKDKCDRLGATFMGKHARRSVAEPLRRRGAQLPKLLAWRRPRQLSMVHAESPQKNVNPTCSSRRASERFRIDVAAREVRIKRVFISKVCLRVMPEVFSRRFFFLRLHWCLSLARSETKTIFIVA